MSDVSIPRIGGNGSRFEAVVMGASLGGVQALGTVLSDLPAHFPLPIVSAVGDGLIAVILAGANGDGAAGVQAVKRTGGRVIVRNERRAVIRRMPQAALASLAMVPGAADLFYVPGASASAG